jgi:hypothetical protein
MRGESDDLGSYQTSKLNSGSWKIRVSSPGFEPQEAIVTLGDREVLQSVMKLEIVTTMMGVIVSVYDDAFPAASEFPMPNYISSQRLPDTAPAPPKPSRNPISRLLSKLHF